jgi:diguanylate cyclase (GGDEF)-like protein
VRIGIGGKGSVRSQAISALLRWSALQLLWLLVLPAAALAVPVALDARICHAVEPIGPPKTVAPDAAFRCGGAPTGYQQASLWLRLDPRQYLSRGTAPTLLLHHTRFDSLTVEFRYADGTTETQQVRSGAFGDHWRPGAQIAFVPSERSARLVAIVLRFDRLASYHLLRMRLVRAGQADIETGILAALIGAALTLLLAGAAYNLSLALGIQRQCLAWQGAWAATMFLWGVTWSQFGLLVAPGMAGTLAAQVCTALSALSVLLATLSTTTALGRGMIPTPLRVTALAFGITVAAIGIPATLARGALVESIAPLLAVAVIGDLCAVMACLIWGMRRGSVEARELIAAWSVPMAALALTQFVDIGSILWGGGPQILVLFASAWQTIWLSIAVSHRLARLRAERDLARAAEARASQLAERDPLTGIRNRRGLVDAAKTLIDAAARAEAPLAMLLIDIDRFKTINDEHGHDAGDVVLCAIATRLARWEGPMCAVARLGGEEFAMIVGHLSGQPLTGFADHVRQEIAACDHSAAIGDGQVTVSIGIAGAQGGGDFAQLYRDADRALYAAKRGGRNRVRHAEQVPEGDSAACGHGPAAAGTSNQRVG